MGKKRHKMRSQALTDSYDLLIIIRNGFEIKFEVIARMLNNAGYKTKTGLKWKSLNVREAFYRVCPQNKQYKKRTRGLNTPENTCTVDGCTRRKGMAKKFLCDFHYKKGD